jgi:ketosteroid isomerase-like protein
MSHVATVQEMYAAFGRGDVAAILERLSESVEWEYGAGPSEVPWLQRRHGRDGAAEFFQSLAALEITKFAPKVFLEAPGLVVVLLDLEARVKATGRTFTEEDEVHIWHMDARGQVARFRHRVDTQRHLAALRGA